MLQRKPYHNSNSSSEETVCLLEEGTIYDSTSRKSETPAQVDLLRKLVFHFEENILVAVMTRGISRLEDFIVT